MTIQQYLDKVNILRKTGDAREHSYRGDLQNLIMAILPGVLVTNEPARVECGAPDYVVTKKDIPIGYIEAKDIGVDLGSKTLKEQFDRYKSGLSNLIFTDYMDFHFYKNGVLTTTIAIAKLENGVIIPLPQNFEQFRHLIKNFAVTISQTIKSPKKLAQMMAGKARLMADVIEKSLNKDDELKYKSNIKSQMLSFQSLLIHDIDNKGFSDIYSQTIAYGMFAARYHDPTLDDFSRNEAAELIPKSNPFLRKLFQDIAGYDLDRRLVWIVDELVNIFLASDVAEIMKNFGKSTKQEDPIVHFYETFLGEYNPALKKARGVWYTPQPVVNFIVRAVDEILKTDFGISQGLADTSKIKVKTKTDVADKRTGSGYREYEKEVHRIQILDPATGTGTFLAEVVKHIYKKFKGQQGIWSKYVKNDLIPRLNGFEILMASYAMAHLKMDMLLTETGYNPEDDQRFNIFLTNSLEEAHPDTGTLFGSWLSDEASQANNIKNSSPIMIVMGNPPYSGVSSNSGKWISDLIEDYKYVDGKHINERKHWLNDDYVKFLRYGQHFIEKNDTGILAFINPHGFLDNATFRGMRWSLLKTYDKIYTIDLHGNSKKNEVSPDGSIDQNVFDIMQGVSINIFIKEGPKKNKKLSKVFHFDLFGKRNTKYDFLSENTISSIDFKELKPTLPNLFFVPKDDSNNEEYYKGINISELFNISSTGIQTSRDKLVIDFNKSKLLERIEEFSDSNKTDDEIRNMFFSHKKAGKYKLGDTRGWKIETARKELNSMNLEDSITKLSYRPFDKRYLFYSDTMVDWTRSSVMNHIKSKENLCLLIPRQLAENNFHHVLIEKNISEMCVISNKTKEQNVVFPLYTYSNNNGQKELEPTAERTPNLNLEIISKISENIGLTYTNEIIKDDTCFAPIHVMDYTYAVLHSPIFRETYKVFLKIDFPRIPYPKNKETFLKLVELGGELRLIHLLESPVVENYITQYPEDGDNIVEKPNYKDGFVFINTSQYFSNVPEVAWNFRIGGYQPAQKWLKDRKGQELNFEDILHYQKIIVALSETDRIMKKIDEIEI
jgi:predicted helicase